MLGKEDGVKIPLGSALPVGILVLIKTGKGKGLSSRMFFNAKVFCSSNSASDKTCDLCKRLSFSRCSKYWPDTRARLPGDTHSVAIAVAAAFKNFGNSSSSTGQCIGKRIPPVWFRGLCGLEGNIGIDGGTSKLLCRSLCSILAVLWNTPCSSFVISSIVLSLRSALSFTSRFTNGIITLSFPSELGLPSHHNSPILHVPYMASRSLSHSSQRLTAYIHIENHTNVPTYR